MTRPPLQRPADDRFLAGVCSGLAVHLGIPVRAVRMGMLVLAALGGAGMLLYLWLWATVPRAGETEGIVPLRRALTRPLNGSDAGTRQQHVRPDVPVPGAASTKATGAGAAVPGAGAPSAGASSAGASSAGVPGAGAPDVAPLRPLMVGSPGPIGSPGAIPTAASGARPADASAQTPMQAPRSRWPIAELLLGAGLLIAGGGLVLERLGVSLELDRILPALAVLVGVGLTWWQVADRDRPDRNQVPRVLGALALVSVGVLMFFVTAREPSAWTVIAAAFAVLAGVALAIAPWLLRLNRELIAERAAREREAERSEIAAHLHDSVLQTLALIQQRSDPGGEVARLARGQERELREWLFRSADGAPPPQREAVDAELRAHAAALEEDHAVRFEVIGVGLGSGTIAPEPVVAAAREAMLNAARHAGGDATVYIEATHDRISIDVTDRGPGLDLEQLPDGRMGVRESILGRMERAGGSARIVPGPGGGGTSVRLSIPWGDQEAAERHAGRSDDTNGSENS